MYFQIALISTIYQIGIGFGAMISSTVDRFGRKRMLLLSIFLAACGGLGNAFATAYWTFCTLRFLTASGLFIKFDCQVICIISTKTST